MLSVDSCSSVKNCRERMGCLKSSKVESFFFFGFFAECSAFSHTLGNSFLIDIVLNWKFLK